MSKNNTTSVKTPYKQALTMLENGFLSQDQLDDMIAKGLVASSSSSRGVGRLVLLGKDGKTQIEPTLYFKGGDGQTQTKEMIELREKFNKLKNEYCTRTTELKVA